MRPCACIPGKSGSDRTSTECHSTCVGACGNLQHNQGNCQACGHDELVAVFRTTGTRSRTRGNVTMTWHDSTCPACG